MQKYQAYYIKSVIQAKTYFQAQQPSDKNLEEHILAYAYSFGYGLRFAPQAILLDLVSKSYYTLFVNNVKYKEITKLVDAKTWIDTVYDGMDTSRGSSSKYTNQLIDIG